MQTPNKENLIKAFGLLLTALLGIPSLQAQEASPKVEQTQVQGDANRTVEMPFGLFTPYVNSERTYTPRARINDSSQVNDNSSPDRVSISTTYSNGLGATIQTVQQHATKTANGEYRHIVAPNDVRTRPGAYSFMAYPSTIKDYNQTGVNISVDYYSTSRFPSEAGVADQSVISVGQILNTSSTAERSAIVYEPGKSRMGQGRGVKTTVITNKVVAGQNIPGNNVRLWSVNASGMPVSTGVYAAGMLQGTHTQNAEGMDKYVLSNRSGNPVYEASFQKRDGILGFDPVTGAPVPKRVYGETYYVYDKLDRLRYTIPPKAVAAISTAGWTLSQAIIDELCFSYLYDADGRQHSTHKPGEQGYTEIVFDKVGKTIMRRSPLEKEKGLWEMLFYDKSDRTIGSGLLTNNNDRAYWQGQASGQTAQASNSPFYYIWGAGKGQYPPKMGLSGTEMMSYNYFDEYPASVLAGETYNPAPFQAHLVTGNTADVPAARASVYGFQTAAEVKVLNNPGVTTYLQDWTNAKNYYDYYGRLIYSVGQNATGSKDSAYHQYNVLGQALRKWYLRNAFHNSANRRTTELESYAYEAYSGRLTGIWRSTNGAVAEPAVRYTYDELGRMNKEVFGNDAETRLYTYNVRGELLGINENYALTGDKSGYDMSFGEALRYDYGFTYPRYDGLVSGMIWRGSGGTGVRAHSYAYVYDSTGRMTSAKYGESRTIGGVTPYWQVNRRNYSQTLAYDLNGNITAGTRWGVSQNPALPGVVQVDDLSYTYLPNSNKLQKVNDAIGNDYQTGDYLPGTAQGYSYDVSGNLTEDKSKNITAVSYTWFNKPEKVSFADGSSIFYTYDAGGNKLQEVVQVSGQNNYTGYISGAVYKNGTISYISTAQGRTNMAIATPRQEYFVKDHLGNIRTTVASATVQVIEPSLQRQVYTAGYEPADEATETVLFDKVTELRADKPGGLNADDQKAALLQDSRRLGTSIMLKVMAGDKMEINADNFYESLQNNNNNNVEATAGLLFEQVIGSLAGGSGALNNAEGSSPNALTERILSNPEAVTAYEDLLAAETDTTRPKAFLNFLFFDEELNLVPEHSRLWQADGENSWSKIGAEETAPLEMPQNGYIVAYLSNQSEQQAYFDNMNLVMTNGLLLEEQHYYAYGLPIAGLSSLAANATKHRQRYQGNEYIEEQGLEWMDFHNRQYDPQLGRFLGIDPLADAGGQQVLSPYHAMGCNPVTMVDPLGLAYEQPRWWNMGQPTARDIAYMTPPTLILDGLYGFGNDPWTLMNRGALNEYEANLATQQRLTEMVSGLLNRAKYNYHVGLEKQRDADLLAKAGADASVQRFETEDKTLEGKDRISIKVGNLTLYISKKDDGTKGIHVFAVYTGDVSKYDKTDWVQIIKSSAPTDGKSYNVWLNDFSKDRDNNGKYINGPFYYNKSPEIQAWRKEMAAKYGGITFQDGPYRERGNFYWQGQLSLVGLRNGTWETIQTVHYGFTTNGMQIDYTPGILLNAPDAVRNTFYQTTMTHINLFKR